MNCIDDFVWFFVKKFIVQPVSKQNYNNIYCSHYTLSSEGNAT